MWTDFEMLIMCLCCMGLGLTIGEEWGSSKKEKRRKRW